MWMLKLDQTNDASIHLIEIDSIKIETLYVSKTSACFSLHKIHFSLSNLPLWSTVISFLNALKSFQAS